MVFDEAIKKFWKESPNGTVVNFAEGLETQRFRLQKDMAEDALWISIDLPEAMAAREKFIEPDDKHLHLDVSVLNAGAWMPLVPKDKPVFFTAQGLFMYLEEEENKYLFQQLADHFPGATLQFDCISKWFSDKATKGDWKLTRHYTTPKMPFGVNKPNVQLLFDSWVPGIQIKQVEMPTDKLDGMLRWIVPLFLSIPYLKRMQPGFFLRVKFPSK
ncbi:unnamed protein product [Cylindrotheca closterium]|uniref:Uncharacterized protein n=1 Tax=Cylindrotheca closterium TaxID=2856 RepID=A0AAD2CKJ4_9STRA|nr:unnamed protein product [Cylindrotheca closterium]